ARPDRPPPRGAARADARQRAGGFGDLRDDVLGLRRLHRRRRAAALSPGQRADHARVRPGRRLGLGERRHLRGRLQPRVHLAPRHQARAGRVRPRAALRVPRGRKARRGRRRRRPRLQQDRGAVRGPGARPGTERGGRAPVARLRAALRGRLGGAVRRGPRRRLGA
ncbi:MAG: hypothetical protein AVDCRST_MAG30-794, partial [uncultured Solirubrobacteraceae bacterium]